MQTSQRTEARLLETNNILITLNDLEESSIQDFFGSVVSVQDSAQDLPDLNHKTVYLCGDLTQLTQFTQLDLRSAERIFVIRELSQGVIDSENMQSVGLGQVPLRVHGVGVFYRRFFEPGIDYFKQISTEHSFQSLTESTKPGKAHRTGIYLTPVETVGDDLHFRLLRCSTNLSGPSENFRATDRQIVDALNQEAAGLFQNPAPLNHVLAQIYHNTPASAEQKQAKAKISAHADKTKDMPENGIMAFCTFYDQLDKLSPLAQDGFDYGYKNHTGLTRLNFRLKAPHPHYPDQFSLTLYPNSVFFMPLSTNRLYTHEIQSSMLNAELLPTRLGYVVRCSSTEAVYKQGQTYLKKADQEILLEPPTLEGMNELRQLYAQENKSQAFIDYGDRFPFSMNQGDYLAPEF